MCVRDSVGRLRNPPDQRGVTCCLGPWFAALLVTGGAELCHELPRSRASVTWLVMGCIILMCGIILSQNFSRVGLAFLGVGLLESSNKKGPVGKPSQKHTCEL